MIVYCLLNLKNGKKYVGQTVSNFRRRYDSYQWWNNKSLNRYLRAAVEKHGPESFIWGVIAECSSLGELNRMEAFYIEHFDTQNPQKGYNLRAGGNGEKYSDYAKEINRLAQVKRWQDEQIRLEQAQKRKAWCSSQENRERMSAVQGCEPVDVYCLKTKQFLGTWLNRTKCASDLGLNAKTVRKACRGELNKYRGFLFVPHGTEPKFDSAKLRHGKAKKIRCVETGQVFACQIDAAKAVGLKAATQFRDYFKGIYKHIKGFQWEYVDDDAD